jgi:hypothetical protein
MYDTASEDWANVLPPPIGAIASVAGTFKDTPQDEYGEPTLRLINIFF